MRPLAPLGPDTAPTAYLNGLLISTVEDGQITEPARRGFQFQVVETHLRHIRITVED